MAVFEDRRFVPKNRFATMVADVTASAAAVLAFGFLFAITFGVL